jgi:hypothetical protein
MLKSQLSIGMKVITINKTNPHQGTSFKNYLNSGDNLPIGYVINPDLTEAYGDVALTFTQTSPIHTPLGGMFFMLDDIIPWSENAEWFYTTKFKREGLL